MDVDERWRRLKRDGRRRRERRRTFHDEEKEARSAN